MAIINGGNAKLVINGTEYPINGIEVLPNMVPAIYDALSESCVEYAKSIEGRTFVIGPFQYVAENLDVWEWLESVAPLEDEDLPDWELS